MTPEQKHPLENFPRYFSIRPAILSADRHETFKIRYRVYCEEFGYEPAERFPQRMESDEFDAISTHCLITHLATGMAAGCMRICPASVNESPRPLPFETCCTDSLDPAAMAKITAPRQQILRGLPICRGRRVSPSVRRVGDTVW